MTTSSTSKHSELYHILYAPGSGGIFINTIFSYYLDSKNSLQLDNITGEAKFQFNSKVTAGHSFNDVECHSSRKIVAITYEDIDDRRHLQTMNFYKFFKPLINNKQNSKLIIDKWGKEFFEKITTLNDNDQKQMFIDTALPGLENDTWSINKNIDKFSLVISFKEVINNSSNLNNKIANFLNVDPLPYVESYIQEWQSYANNYTP